MRECALRDTFASLASFFLRRGVFFFGSGADSSAGAFFFGAMALARRDADGRGLALDAARSVELEAHVAAIGGPRVSLEVGERHLAHVHLPVGGAVQDDARRHRLADASVQVPDVWGELARAEHVV